MYVPTILASPLLIVNDMCYGVTVEPSAAEINAYMYLSHLSPLSTTFHRLIPPYNIMSSQIKQFTPFPNQKF